MSDEDSATYKGFTLYEPPPRKYELPPDFKQKSKSVSRLNIKEYEPTIGLNERIKERYRLFYRPYRDNTQKGVNNSLRFDFEKLNWMDVADIIINKKDQEFMDIIELYRENHNHGYEENQVFTNSEKDRQTKKKKKKGMITTPDSL